MKNSGEDLEIGDKESQDWREVIQSGQIFCGKLPTGKKYYYARVRVVDFKKTIYGLKW